MYLVVTSRSEANQTVANGRSVAAFTAWYMGTPTSLTDVCKWDIDIQVWVTDGTHILGGAGSSCDNIQEIANKVNKIKVRQRSLHFKNKYSARRSGIRTTKVIISHCSDQVTPTYLPNAWCSKPLIILYTYFLLIRSYLTSLIPTSFTPWADSVICPFVKRTQTSFLPLSYQLEHCLVCERINHSQLPCGCLQVPSLFFSLRSTSFNVSTHFPTCLCTLISTEQAAFACLQSTSRDGRADLQYTSYAWTCKTTVFSSSWFLRNFSSQLFMMPTSN